MSDDLRRQALEQLERDKQAGYGNPEPLVSLFPTERQPLSDKGAENFVSIVFASSKDGTPHVVTKQPDGTLRCTCMAMLSIESRPQGCWAMGEVRRIAGMPTP